MKKSASNVLESNPRQNVHAKGLTRQNDFPTCFTPDLCSDL